MKGSAHSKSHDNLSAIVICFKGLKK